MEIATPEPWTLQSTQAYAAAINERVGEIDANVVKLLAADEARTKAKAAKATAKAAQDKKDKENNELNMKKLSDALKKIPYHLNRSAQELKAAAEVAEAPSIVPSQPPPRRLPARASSKRDMPLRLPTTRTIRSSVPGSS